jgi:5-methylcytosine-specific restriction protein A
MPYKPPSACAIPSCPELALPGGIRCRRHQRLKDAERPTAHARGYDGSWNKIRASYLRRHPQCAICRVREATDVHHLVRVKDGGGHSDSNLMALCHSCHSRITAREDARLPGRR